jgi:hypothetical protein
MKWRRRLRTLALWISGLIASAMVGGFVVELAFPNWFGGSAPGSVAGMAAFTCARLWLTETR